MQTWIELPKYLFKDIILKVNVEEVFDANGNMDLNVEFSEADGLQVNLKEHVTDWINEEEFAVDFRRTDNIVEIGFPDVNTAMRFKLKWSIK